MILAKSSAIAVGADGTSLPKKHLPMNPKSAWIVGFKVYDLFLAFSKRATHKKSNNILPLACMLFANCWSRNCYCNGSRFFCSFFFSHTLFWRVFSILLTKIYRIFLRIFPPHLIVCISVFDICDLFTWEFFEMVLPRGLIPPFARL